MWIINNYVFYRANGPVSCDLEKAISFIPKHNALLNGCEFHWKQEIRQKLIEHNLPKAVLTKLRCTNGVMNIFTVIPNQR